jgi:hypothetical protein
MNHMNQNQTETAGEANNYEANFIGALVGLDIANSYANYKLGGLFSDIINTLLISESIIDNQGNLTNEKVAKLNNERAEGVGSAILEIGETKYRLKPDTITRCAWVTPIGLLYSYGHYDQALFKNVSQLNHYYKELEQRFGNNFYKFMLLTDSDTVLEFDKNYITTYRMPNTVGFEAELTIAVNVLVRHEILPEDLMSAILDYYAMLRSGPYHLRGKLLAVQDYIEERQTFVDNIEAGDFLGFSTTDITQVDLRNMARAFNYKDSSEDSTDGDLTAACYAFIAHKDSFSDALKLAYSFTETEPSTMAKYKVPLFVGILAGAYHGIEAIPNEWKKQSPNYDRIVDIAKRLHTVARTRY